MFKKFARYYYTLKYLKLQQIWFQLFYRLKTKVLPHSGKRLVKYKETPKSAILTFQPFVINPTSWKKKNHFEFLNLSKPFEEEGFFSTPIDWNFSAYGKLWTYNLNYFDNLFQANLDRNIGLRLIEIYIKDITKVKDGLEPFPASLRIQNWVKFLSLHRIKNSVIDQSLFAQLQYLNKNLEYHLLGNHLLENGFALLFGAYYFQDKLLFQKAEKLLSKELAEQVLPDGGHFELSPMYHKIMLHRVLDSLNLIQNNAALFIVDDLSNILKLIAEKMLGWLNTMTFSNGETPDLNDSTKGIVTTTESLKLYAKNLNIHPKKIVLKESGYRRIEGQNFEMICDVGQIGPSYIPGHAHSDSLNFVLNIKEIPFIVDTGISTYEKNEIRQKERSTAAHNTVQISQLEQSDIWGGFRVGKRANIALLEEKTNQYLSATQDGYSSLNIQHTRTFHNQTNQLLIEDTITGNPKQLPAFAHFHLSPLFDPILNGNEVKTTLASIRFDQAENITITEYNYCEGFNKIKRANKLIIQFSERLITTIAL